MPKDSPKPAPPPTAVGDSKPETSIPQVIAELRSMPVADLVQRYEAVYGKPPRVKHREWLWRRIAWKVQEQRFGGLSQVARRRIDEIVETLDLPFGKAATVRGSLPTKRASDPVAGTTVSRVWRGREVCATRTESGWTCDGIEYRSLSAVAKAVSGSHVSGPAWFGLARKEAR